jgi:hypothetical protein
MTTMAATAKRLWPTRPKIFTVWPFREKASELLFSTKAAWNEKVTLNYHPQTNSGGLRKGLFQLSKRKHTFLNFYKPL